VTVYKVVPEIVTVAMSTEGEDRCTGCLFRRGTHCGTLKFSLSSRCSGDEVIAIGGKKEDYEAYLALRARYRLGVKQDD